MGNELTGWCQCQAGTHSCPTHSLLPSPALPTPAPAGHYAPLLASAIQKFNAQAKPADRILLKVGVAGWLLSATWAAECHVGGCVPGGTSTRPGKGPGLALFSHLFKHFTATSFITRAGNPCGQPLGGSRAGQCRCVWAWERCRRVCHLLVNGAAEGVVLCSGAGHPASRPMHAKPPPTLLPQIFTTAATSCSRH